jgi:hypothetical protein
MENGVMKNKEIIGYDTPQDDNDFYQQSYDDYIDDLIHNKNV